MEINPWFSFLSLIVISIILPSTWANKKYTGPSEPVDYQPFREAIRAAIAATSDIPHLSLNATTSDCVMPKSSIMFTYATKYMQDLLLLRQKAMDVWGLRSCLERRFITACLDEKCYEFCQKHKIGQCIWIKMPDLPPSDFAKDAYFYLTYLPVEFSNEALKVVDEAFYFDADVLLLRNPWLETRYGRDNKGNRVPGLYDMMYQRDRGTGMGCGGSINAGVFYLRNSTKTQQFLGHMQLAKDAIVQNWDGKLQQEFAGNSAELACLKMCSFSIDLYIATCQRSHNAGAPVSKVITYHAACVDGGAAGKRRAMNRFLKAAEMSKEKPSTVIGRHVGSGG